MEKLAFYVVNMLANISHQRLLSSLLSNNMLVMKRYSKNVGYHLLVFL